jgi:hypothetical protein
VGTRFSAPVQTGPEAHPASYTMSIGSFPGVKWPGRDVDHPPPFRAEVKDRAELYLYSPLGLRVLLQGDLYLYVYGHVTLLVDHNDIYVVLDSTSVLP